MENPRIAIIGLGYVGLPLAVAFSEKYKVIGFDISNVRIDQLNKGVDSTQEITNEELINTGSDLSFTSNPNDVSECDIYIITVPTPIDSTNMPDLTPLKSASEIVGNNISKGNIVIYESTVYPGVTEDICVPILEKVSQLSFNKDFFCGYSPERINPGDKTHTVKNILKVTSGSNPEIAIKVDTLYSSVISAGTFLASSIKVAEASKVIENTQRDVNIALINELSLIFDLMGLDTKDVIEAASTKWNFIKLMPGLVGGHCIGVDPYYLTFKAQEIGYKPNLILGARHINNSMAKHVSDATIKQMILNDIKVKNSNVLVLGATFKENCPDLRNSKVFDLVSELQKYDCNISIYEPWINIDVDKFNVTQVDDPFESNIKYDVIIGAVNHSLFSSIDDKKFLKICHSYTVTIDLKNIFSKPTWSL